MSKSSSKHAAQRPDVIQRVFILELCFRQNKGYECLPAGAADPLRILLIATFSKPSGCEPKSSTAATGAKLHLLAKN
jgi:hypothetical protein